MERSTHCPFGNVVTARRAAARPGLARSRVVVWLVVGSIVLVVGARSGDAAASSPAVAKAPAVVAAWGTQVGPIRRLARRLAGEPVFSVRSAGTSVAWLTREIAADGTRSDQVSVYDTDQHRFWLRKEPAIPAVSGSGGASQAYGEPVPAAGQPASPGRVSTLRIAKENFVGWIANGSTVVVGAQIEGDFTLGPIVAEPPATVPVPSEVGSYDPEFRRTSRGLAIVGRYPDDPATRAALRQSLRVREFDRVDPGMPPNEGCEFLTSGVYTWRAPDGAQRMAQAYVARRSYCRWLSRERRKRRASRRNDATVSTTRPSDPAARRPGSGPR